MTEPLIAAAVRLTDVLERENAALAALDLPRAAGLGAEKQAMVQAFTDHQARAGSNVADYRVGLEAPMGRLRTLAIENRLLLERALVVQTRVMGLIAQAIRPVVGPPRYGSRGEMTATSQPRAFTLSARA